MANSCCFCIGLRSGTIIITMYLLAIFLLIPFSNDREYIIYSDPSNMTEKPIQIDGSPRGVDYIFAIFLPVVTFAMLLSAIFKKSEILFYAMITFIIAFILLTVYATVGEERGSWFLFKFPPTGFYQQDEKLYTQSKPTVFLISVIRYVTGGYFMFVVYSYVQQLREGIPTFGQVIRV